jgi:hypothetical protein
LVNFFVERADEAIPAPTDCFHKPWIVSLVAQGIPQLFHRNIDGVIKVAKLIPRPERSPDLSAGNDLTRPFQKHGEDLKWLLLDPDDRPRSAQFACPQVRDEGSKPDSTASLHRAQYLMKR